MRIYRNIVSCLNVSILTSAFRMIVFVTVSETLLVDLFGIHNLPWKLELN